MSTVTEKFQCPVCFDLHADHYGAEHCCDVEIRQVYVCDECGADFYSKEDAVECCPTLGPDGEELPYQPTAAELEAAGQMRLEMIP